MYPLSTDIYAYSVYRANSSPLQNCRTAELENYRITPYSQIDRQYYITTIR